MKKTLLLLSISILIFSCQHNKPKSSFELSGTFQNGDGAMLTLVEITPHGFVPVDSTTIDKQGNFSFTDVHPHKGFYNLQLSTHNYVTLILDSTLKKVNVTGDAKNLGYTYKVEGSPESQLYWEFNQESKRNFGKRDSLKKLFQAYVNKPHMSKARIDSLSNAIEKPFDDLMKQQNDYITQFINQHLTSLVSLIAIQQLNPNEYMDYYVKLDSAMNKKFPTSPYVQLFHKKLVQIKRLAIGSEAPNISLPNPNGKVMSLKSLRGHIVLIDFWASWCGPCMAELPNVVKMYHKYHDKGFDVFSVSLDKDKAAWKKAIKEKGLVWKTQVSDLKYWQSSVVQLYNFNSIPHTVLIDKEGKIIAKNLRGQELDNKLAQVFSKK